jgi:hypothetical protein
MRSDSLPNQAVYPPLEACPYKVVAANENCLFSEVVLLGGEVIFVSLMLIVAAALTRA